MKKLICMILPLCLLLLALTTVSASGFGVYSSHGRTYAVVNNPNPADRLHLRVQPRVSATSLGRYYNGVTVEVIGYPSFDWVKVRIGSTEGFMMRQYLTSGSVAPASPTVQVKNPKPTERLNLRTSMSETSTSLGKYANGTQVLVLGVGLVWHHVSVNGKIGYMMAKYLTPVDGAGNPSPGATWLNVKNPNPYDRLNLRVAPRADAASIGRYYNGVTVEVLSYPSSDWAEVRIGNTIGFMQRKFLTANHVSSAIPTVKVKNPNAYEKLNLRASMSITSAVLARYGNGTKVEVLGVGAVWYHVRVDGKIGYMMATYLSSLN